MKKRKKTKRILCRYLLMTAVITLCLALLGGCTLDSMGNFGQGIEESENEDFIDRIRQQEQANPFGGGEKMSAERLAHEITQAINTPESIGYIYSGLGSEQREEVSGELFRRYIEALRPANGEKIIGFEELTDVEIQEFQTLIFAHRPELTDQEIMSRYFRLEFSPAGSTRRIGQEVKSLILAVQTGDDGAYLSKNWVEAVVRIHDYALLYFDALSQDVLKKEEIESIAWLLQESDPAFEGEGREKYSFAKARATGEYYLSTVTTEPRSSACLYLLPGIAAYEQEYRYGNDLSGTRIVRFMDKNGVYSVEEPIPSEQTAADKVILIYGNELFPQTIVDRYGVYKSTEIHPLAGPVLGIKEIDLETPPKIIPGQIAKPRKFEIAYYGMKIIIIGQADEQSLRWQGRVESVTLESRVGSLGQAIRPGMEESAFHLYYPFHRENKGVLQGDGEPFEKMILSYSGENGRVGSITLERAD